MPALHALLRQPLEHRQRLLPLLRSNLLVGPGHLHILFNMFLPICIQKRVTFSNESEKREKRRNGVFTEANPKLISFCIQQKRQFGHISL